MLSNLQKQTSQAIINIFETGEVLGNYSNVTSVEGDPGGLTYGRSQTTLMSNLAELIENYCNAENAKFASQLRPYLGQLKAKDKRLNYNQTLHNLLRQAGYDPVMQATQDTFFDRVYWNPSVEYANSIGIKTPLGVTVVYDSVVHGSWQLMRDRTTRNFGNITNIGEQSWIKHYIDTRREWLANHQIELLHKTVYRMDAFKNLISTGKWELSLPLNVRNLSINEETLNKRNSGRVLSLKQPFMQGEDVRQVQEALVKLGYKVDVDGIFGPATAKAVKQFQQDKNLTVDGIVGQATRTALGL